MEDYENKAINLQANRS